MKMLREEGEYEETASKYSSPVKNEGKLNVNNLLYAELAWKYIFLSLESFLFLWAKLITSASY